MRTKEALGMRCTPRYEMKRVNHEEAYSLDGACDIWRSPVAADAFAG